MTLVLGTHMLLTTWIRISVLQFLLFLWLFQPRRLQSESRFAQQGCCAGRDHVVGVLHSLQECEQLQKMYGGHMDERTLEKTQQQHMLYQQEQHHQILHQQIQVLEPGPWSLNPNQLFLQCHR